MGRASNGSAFFIDLNWQSPILTTPSLIDIYDLSLKLRPSAILIHEYLESKQINNMD